MGCFLHPNGFRCVLFFRSSYVCVSIFASISVVNTLKLYTSIMTCSKILSIFILKILHLVKPDKYLEAENVLTSVVYEF